MTLKKVIRYGRTGSIVPAFYPYPMQWVPDNPYAFKKDEDILGVPLFPGDSKQELLTLFGNIDLSDTAIIAHQHVFFSTPALFDLLKARGMQGKYGFVLAKNYS